MQWESPRRKVHSKSIPNDGDSMKSLVAWKIDSWLSFQVWHPKSHYRIDRRGQLFHDQRAASHRPKPPTILTRKLPQTGNCHVIRNHLLPVPNPQQVCNDSHWQNGYTMPASQTSQNDCTPGPQPSLSRKIQCLYNHAHKQRQWKRDALSVCLTSTLKTFHDCLRLAKLHLFLGGGLINVVFSFLDTELEKDTQEGAWSRYCSPMYWMQTRRVITTNIYRILTMFSSKKKKMEGEKKNPHCSAKGESIDN